MVALTYVMLTFCLVAAGVMASARTPPSLASWDGWLMLGFALAALCLVVREARRDLHQLCVYWCYLGVLGGGCAFGGIAGLFSKTAASVVLGLVGATWLASVVVLLRDRFAKGLSPLLTRVPADAAHEEAGVQFFIEPADEAQLASGAFDIRILLQNCWDAERTVSIRIDGQSGLLGLPAPVRIDDAAARVTLAPRELGLWTLPVQVRTPKRTSLWLDVRVSGLGGRRVFGKRVRTVPMRVPRRLTLLVAVASLGLSWVWGGGLWVRVPASQRLGDPGERRRTWRRIEA